MRLALVTLLPIIGAWAAAASATASVSEKLPYAQSSQQDRHGREWNIDQNGNLQRPSNTPSLISNAAVLMMGNQQFYCQQPTTSSDGSLLFMAGPKPYNGISVTRQLSFMEKEGGVAYADAFSNVTGREIQTVIEFRYHFSGQVKKLVTDTGRASPTALEPGEQGIIVEPSQNDGSMPAVVVTLTSSGAETPPKLALRNSFQLSVFHTLTIPPGDSATIIHCVGQVDLAGDGSTEALTRHFRDWELKRIARQLPKDWTKSAVNLISESPMNALKEWFPLRHWGIERGVSDILALGDDSQLKGRALAKDLILEHALGKTSIDWDQVVAIAGVRHPAFDETHLWLADGQILKGTLSATEPRFELTSGTSMPLDFTRLDRLVRGTTHGPPAGRPTPLEGGLLETWEGERLAISSGFEWKALSRWGPISLPWDQVLTWSPLGEDGLPPMLVARDGSRFRALGPPPETPFQTRLFGEQMLHFSQLRQAIHPDAILAAPDDTNPEPSETFLDLAGDQRLVAQVTDARITISTTAGPLNVAPGEIRELRDVTDDHDDSASPNQHWHQIELWGGGSVLGHVQNIALHVEAPGLQWSLPVREIRRWVNPLPRIETHVLHRITDLIGKLGHPEWKLRESASAQLAELGPLASPSLREALRQSTDPEVTRRIEMLLSNWSSE